MSGMKPLGGPDSDIVGRGNRNFGYVSTPDGGNDIGDGINTHDTFGVNKEGDVFGGHTTVQQGDKKVGIDW